LLIVIFYLVESSAKEGIIPYGVMTMKIKWKKKIYKNDAKFEFLNINWFLGGEKH